MVSVLAVVGPSASGKSDYALELVERNQPAALINADAFALYRGMNIGTAKPVEQLRTIENYMFDILDPVETSSVSVYRHQVLELIDNLVKQEKTVVLVGGSGLYVRSALDQMNFPPTSQTVRDRWWKIYEDQGGDYIYATLLKLAPQLREQIEPTNIRKNIRILEVIELTGKPPQLNMSEPQYLRPTLQMGFRFETSEIETRIRQRTRKMLDSGLIEEVIQLQDQLGPTARKAIGYRETLQYLNGEITLEQLEQLINLHTRQLVKRQLTWFNKDQRIQWKTKN
jgi:tRNA dimethylallyltransferase